MSGIAKSWLKRQTIEDRTLMAILSALAHEADQEGRCEITQAKIVALTRIQERAVRNGIALLERLDIITRQRSQTWGKRGRSADAICLNTSRDFTLNKEQIMSERRMGPTGTKCRLIGGDQPAPDAGAPTIENGPRLYKERARSVTTPTSTSNPSFPVRVSSRVRLDRQRNSWRALLTVDDVTMELGRFDTEAEAKAYADQAVADVRRTSSMKAGMPSFPVISPTKANLDAPALGAWLFGDGAEENAEGVGEASALGQGTKFLAGLGGAHDLAEYDAARARGSIQ